MAKIAQRSTLLLKELWRWLGSLATNGSNEFSTKVCWLPARSEKILYQNGIRMSTKLHNGSVTKCRKPVWNWMNKLRSKGLVAPWITHQRSETWGSPWCFPEPKDEPKQIVSAQSLARSSGIKVTRIARKSTLLLEKPLGWLKSLATKRSNEL